MVTNTDSMYYEGEEVCFHGGRAWAVELVEIEPMPDGKRRWDARALCLGKEADILPILRGKAPVPDNMHARRKAVLEGILERSKHERTGTVKPNSSRKLRAIKACNIRVRPAKGVKHGAKHLKRA